MQSEMRKLTIIILFLGLFSACYAPSVKSLALIKPDPIRKHYTESDKLQAIIQTETGPDGKRLYNRNEPQAVGILQEWPILVYDCNRILGYNKYKLSDRMVPKKAIEMFYVYQNYYNPTLDFEAMARLWCAGPDGITQPSSLPYYKLALKQLYTL